MTVTLYSYPHGAFDVEATYVRVQAPFLDVTFCKNILGFLGQTVPPPDLETYTIDRYTLEDSHKPLVQDIKRIFLMVQEDIHKIAAWYGWGSLKDGFYSFNRFAEKLQEINEQPGFREMHLLGLKLHSIPFQIGLLTNMRRLVLHNNHIAFLPPDLTKLKKLNFLDLSSNPICALPEWFKTQMGEVNVKSDSILQDDPEEDVLTQPLYSEGELGFSDDDLMVPPLSPW